MNAAEVTVGVGSLRPGRRPRASRGRVHGTTVPDAAAELVLRRQQRGRLLTGPPNQRRHDVGICLGISFAISTGTLHPWRWRPRSSRVRVICRADGPRRPGVRDGRRPFRVHAAAAVDAAGPAGSRSCRAARSPRNYLGYLIGAVACMVLGPAPHRAARAGLVAVAMLTAGMGLGDTSEPGWRFASSRAWRARWCSWASTAWALPNPWRRSSVRPGPAGSTRVSGWASSSPEWWASRPACSGSPPAHAWLLLGGCSGGGGARRVEVAGWGPAFSAPAGTRAASGAKRLAAGALLWRVRIRLHRPGHVPSGRGAPAHRDSGRLRLGVAGIRPRRRRVDRGHLAMVARRLAPEALGEWPPRHGDRPARPGGPDERLDAALLGRLRGRDVHGRDHGGDAGGAASGSRDLPRPGSWRP